MRTPQVMATFDDVNLILKLYDMRREPRLREARQWYSASFRPKTLEELHTLCPPGSDQNAFFRMVTTYWEMAASFLTSGVLNKELFYQSGRELLFCWERLRDVAPAHREAIRNPLEWANLEAVANEYIAWWNARAPGAHEAFSKRIRG
jgi:hypothetical protein